MDLMTSSPWYSELPESMVDVRRACEGPGNFRRKFGSVDAAFLSMSARESQFTGGFFGGRQECIGNAKPGKKNRDLEHFFAW